MRHMSGFLWAEFDKPVYMSRGTTVCGLISDECHNDPARGFVGGIYMMTEALGLPYFAAFSRPFGWGRSVSRDIERYRYLTGCWFCGEDMPQTDNRVSLDASERDGSGLPVPHIHLDDHANETAMKNYGFKRVAALYDAAGARRTIEQQPLPSTHNLGTARMSADPWDGVCNRWGQVHEVANVFISDGSAFPTAGAANPTLTIVALALRQTDHVAERLRNGSL